MSQYLVRSRHRAVRGWSYGLQDRPPVRRETLDTSIQVFETPDDISLRAAIAFVAATEWPQADKPPPEDAPWITSL